MATGYTLQCLSRQPGSQASIARVLGVHPTTVGREFPRAGLNRQTDCHITAQQAAEAHAWAGRTLAPELLQAAEAKLCQGAIESAADQRHVPQAGPWPYQP